MTLVETVYSKLREAIVVGQYAPEVRLKAEHIKEEYMVSASTVREALNRLISDGLVVAHDRRGFSVAPFSTSDLSDIIKTRLLIEVEVLRQSVIHGDDAWEMALVGAYHQLAKLERIVDIYDEENLENFEVANRAFHDCLTSACPSPILTGFYHQLFTRHYRYRRAALRDTTILKKARRDHKALLTAAIDREVETAVAIIERHISRTLLFSEDLITSFEKISTTQKANS